MNSFLENTLFEVLTPDGFKDFAGYSITSDKAVIRVVTAESQIICTPDHEIFSDTENKWVQAENLKVGSQISGSTVTDIRQVTEQRTVVDLVEVKDVSCFYANGILVHNCILLDEFAHVPQNLATEFFASVYPTISSGKLTKIIIVSTALGMNHFYKMWTDAKEGRSSYVPIQVDWWEVPGRDEAWKEETIRNTSQVQFDQEYGNQFIGSVNTLISARTIQNMAWKEPLYTKDGLDVFENPIQGHVYATLVDVSRGQGIDYSAFSVVDMTEMPYKQVAKYRSDTISTLLYPSIIYKVSKDYNEASVLIEISDCGLEVANILYYDLEYPNVLFVRNAGRKGQVLSTGYGTGVNMGLKTSKQTKSIGCRILKDLVEEHKLLIEDFHTIQEMSTFVAKGGSYEADEGTHDDLVMTLVFFAWLTTQDSFRELVNMDLRRDIYSKQLIEIEEELTPFGFIVGGPDPDDGKEYEVDADGCRWEVVNPASR